MGNSEPELTETIMCGHCGNKARMEVVATYDRIQSYEMDLGMGTMPPWEAGHIWQLALCPACSGLTLRELDYHTGKEPEIGIVDKRVLYPQRNPLQVFRQRSTRHTGMPSKYAKLTAMHLPFLLGESLKRCVLTKE
jgi:hypothetical protein